ncbi:hypothetical protein RRU01S_32_00420 [Agrobacterium rubi TR3 = NBRC 13261]|nr:hypothetical protein [Agrobacterium rubi]GAK73180.1 hypothetical protein RRU01S_32_00420 [Agrobacterium rubi TR3 = NBRC 13261]
MQRLNPGTSVRLRSYAILAVTTVMMLVTGCTSVREPYSQADADKAQIVGFENVRVPLDANISAFIEN